MDFLRVNITWPLCAGATRTGVMKPTRWGAAPRGFRTARRLIKACAKHLALIEPWPLNDSSQPDRSSSHPGNAAEAASLRLLEENQGGKLKYSRKKFSTELQHLVLKILCHLPSRLLESVFGALTITGSFIDLFIDIVSSLFLPTIMHVYEINET